MFHQLKRPAANAATTADDGSSLIRLRINEEILPRSCIHVVLDCFYHDKIDLTSIVIPRDAGSLEQQQGKECESVLSIWEVTSPKTLNVFVYYFCFPYFCNFLPPPICFHPFFEKFTIIEPHLVIRLSCHYAPSFSFCCMENKSKHHFRWP